MMMMMIMMGSPTVKTPAAAPACKHLPTATGGLGLPCAQLASNPAYVASWVDSNAFRRKLKSEGVGPRPSNCGGGSLLALPLPPSGSWIGRVRPTDSIAQRRWVDAHQLVKKAHEQPEGAAREGLACSDWMVVSASAVT